MASITPVTSGDHAEWFSLWNAYLAFYESTLDAEVSDSTFTRLVDPESPIHGAIARDDEGVACGIVHWLAHPATWTRTTYCYLEDLFVDPGRRGSGIGTALIAHVRAWAEQNGSTKLYWLTAETNATARALYDRVSTRTGMIQYQITL